MAKPPVSLFLAVIAGYLLSVLSKLQVWEANLSVKLLFFRKQSTSLFLTILRVWPKIEIINNKSNTIVKKELINQIRVPVRTAPHIRSPCARSLYTAYYSSGKTIRTRWDRP